MPNLVIVLRTFLTLAVSVATGDRSSSKLKLGKIYLRSTMSQDRLVGLATLSIEYNITQFIEVKLLIELPF